jgi:predicted transcriptional regulator
MFRLPHHPKAFLSLRRNIQPGLLARTQLISVLEERTSTIMKISRETGLSYNVVLYHLHLLEAEKIVTRKGRRLYIWELTGIGQQTLVTGK